MTRSKTRSTIKTTTASRERVELLLALKKLEGVGVASSDPIAAAMVNNPSLTRQRAEELAELFGF
jgi:hypothetical protein